MNVQCVGSWENFRDHEMAPYLNKANQLFDKLTIWDPLYSGRFIGKTDDEAETTILWPPDVKKWLIWKDPDAGKDWRQEKKGMTGWNGWMASPTQWTWVWVNCGSWWWTRRPGLLQSMGLKRVGHNWVTELNWKYLYICMFLFVFVYIIIYHRILKIFPYPIHWDLVVYPLYI